MIQTRHAIGWGHGIVRYPIQLDADDGSIGYLVHICAVSTNHVNLSIIIAWIQLNLVGLTMLLMGLHPSLSCQHMPQTTLEIALSDELQAANIC